MSKKVLLKDIVIKAGTVFDTAPNTTRRDDSFYECTVGLSINTSGSFTYGVDHDYADELDGFFADLQN